jgi:hypothetical protein
MPGKDAASRLEASGGLGSADQARVKQTRNLSSATQGNYAALRRRAFPSIE